MALRRWVLATRMKSRLPWSIQDSLDLNKIRLGLYIFAESWKVNNTGESLWVTGNVFVAAGIFFYSVHFLFASRVFSKALRLLGATECKVVSKAFWILLFCLSTQLSATRSWWERNGPQTFAHKNFLNSISRGQGGIFALDQTKASSPKTLRAWLYVRELQNLRLGRKVSLKLNAERRLVTSQMLFGLFMALITKYMHFAY